MELDVICVSKRFDFYGIYKVVAVVQHIKVDVRSVSVGRTTTSPTTATSHRSSASLSKPET